MFRDLRAKVSQTRRVLAWILVALLLGVGVIILPWFSTHPTLRLIGDALFWAVLAYGIVRLFTFLLLDPLLSHRKTATPGFARDLIVVALYLIAMGGVLREVLHIGLGQLLGTGAIAAAVVGLSLQEVLGNLFAGISLHLDPAFQEGDWLEITGSWRGGPGRETQVAQVEAMTWRTVQLRTENGDMDILPNRVIAQAVVTNLYVPSGFHRRVSRVVVEPGPRLHQAIDKLTLALAGLPHLEAHRPEVVVQGSDLGGAILEMRFWALGFRHGRQATYHASRLAATVLPREGFRLMGVQGPTPLPKPLESQAGPEAVATMIQMLGLPDRWTASLSPHFLLRHLAPGEAILREGDAGDSLFAVQRGTLQVVHAEQGEEPYTGLFWHALGELGPGEWFGEASLLTGAPRQATVVAVTEAEVLELPKEAFNQLKQDPELTERLVDLMAQRHRDPDSANQPRESLRAQWSRQIRAWFGLGGPSSS